VSWPVGKSPSAEHRQKLSTALVGRPKCAEHRDNISKAKLRERNPAWRGGRHLTHGYVQIKVGTDHPMANSKGYALEHRLVMAGLLGRLLTSDETVHHVDGDKTNNAPENLQLRKGRHGNGCTYLCGDCGSINVLSVEL